MTLPPDVEASLSADPRWQLVVRVSQSRAFSRSARLRDFLLFVSRHCLEGRGVEVTEWEIGRQIFERGEDYVPAEDAVVRGAARQLRLKLREYFETEGRQEAWRVEVPKGGYLPVFSERSAPTRAVAPPAPGVPVAPARSSRAPLIYGVLTALNLALLAAHFWVGRSEPAPAASRERPTVISAFLDRTPGTVPLVVTDFSMALLRQLFRPEHYTLNDYASWNYAPLRPSRGSAEERLLLHADILRTHRITRFGDMTVMARILRSRGGERVLVRHARDVSARSFQDGNAILLGNGYSTPWVDLFEERVNFRTIREERGVGFENRAPRNGEPAEYLVAAPEREHGLGYGRLALVPNLAGRGSVLLVTGVNMVTMESVGEFAADPEATGEILRALHVESLDRLPYFELILETQAVDNTPKRAKILAARNLGS